ncbi:Gfo/Idh/MocA family protein [Sporofaciens musculi]|jgi:predicted dehydrogenase|uniref:Gfo/Idh/MocA family protein n=1 Tax=Sporofaciens musculi TaxID=2681861 RepID=UPI002571000C|nr:Gfo/Idh/MocA family oxidoreductase [Sporofaciens musculi]
MIFLVIGLGSMGRRRVRLLKQYISNGKYSGKEWKIIGTDFSEVRRKEAEALLGIETYMGLEDAIQKNSVDCAIISSPPLSHSSIIKECLKQKLHVFTELNLVDEGYNENIAMAENQRNVLFLSSTLMYRKETQYIKEVIRSRASNAVYHYHIGQYLPDWHPWESYHDFFAGHRRTNGCRELFAIELPWLADAFGEIISVQAVHRKMSKLEIDYDDTYQVLLEHKTGIIGNLAVDVVIPKAGREFEVWGEGFYLEWKGTPDSLKEYDEDTKRLKQIELYDYVEHMEGYSQFVIENAYYEELVNYIDVVKGRQKPRYTFEMDKKILQLIDRIEE